MKLSKSALAALAIGVASISSAQAGHNDIGWSISFGSPTYYAPAPVYYAAPPVVYYEPRTVYYRPAPVVYSPYVTYGGYYGGHRHHGWRGEHRGRHGGHHHRGRDRDWR